MSLFVVVCHFSLFLVCCCVSFVGSPGGPDGPGCQCGPGGQGCLGGLGGPGSLGDPGGPCHPGPQCGPGDQGGPGDQACQCIWFAWSKQSDVTPVTD